MPNDPEATYRKKGGESARGYVANITETCDPDVVTDAGYTGPTAAQALESHQVKQKTSAIKGRKKETDTLGLEVNVRRITRYLFPKEGIEGSRQPVFTSIAISGTW